MREIDLNLGTKHYGKKNLKIMATCAASAAALALVAPASAAVYTYNVNVTQIQAPARRW